MSINQIVSNYSCKPEGFILRFFYAQKKATNLTPFCYFLRRSLISVNNSLSVGPAGGGVGAGCFILL